jgi:tRNA A-37 threonylcarbamoyl transferase component Bud32
MLTLMSAGARTWAEPANGTFHKKWIEAHEVYGRVWITEHEAYRRLSGLRVTPAVVDLSERLLVLKLHTPLGLWIENRGRGERLQLSGKLRAAIGRMHAAGICHRDLYVANVVVDESDQPLIVDFELARLDVDPIADCYDLVGARSGVAKPAAHITEHQPDVHWHQPPTGGISLEDALRP